MRVLHVITYLSDGGGAEKLMEDLIPTMKDKGIDVSIAVLRDIDTANYRHLRSEGINIIKVGRGDKLYSLSKMLRLLKIMKDFDVVHTHLTPPFLMGAFNSCLCKVKLVHTIHSTNSKMRNIFFLRKIEKWAMNRYHTIIPCSKEAEDSLRLFMGQTSQNIVTINNGVKLTKFKNASPSKYLDSSAVKITMVAVFRPSKDHETIIKATSLLPDNFHTYLVGYGERVEEMKSFAKNLGVNDRVHFLGKRTDVAEILKASDFVVLASHFEGLSLSSIEGMAVGKPFIASDVPGLRELVGGYGELFEDNNAEQLAKIINRLASDKSAYQEVAAKCLKRSEAFDMNNMADGYITVYNNMIG